MPTWHSLLNEVKARGSTFDVVRRERLKTLAEKTARNVIIYYSGWLQKPKIPGTQVTDADKKQALADIYRDNFQEYAKIGQSNSYQEGDLRYEQREKITESAMYLVENFHRVPVMMIPCIAGNLDKAPTFMAASAGDACVTCHVGAVARPARR